jgi:putative phage-type endonuclease
LTPSCRRLASRDEDEELWLAARRGLVTASDTPVLFGHNPRKTVQRLFWEKKNDHRIPDNAHMRRGREQEASILAEWAERHGEAPYRRLDCLLVSERYPWMGASPDAVAKTNNDTVLVEAKCPRSLKKALDEWLPSYLDQLAHQLVVTGFDTGYLAIRDSEGKYAEAVVMRTQQLEDEIVAATQNFYRSLVDGCLGLEYW